VALRNEHVVFIHESTRSSLLRRHPGIQQDRRLQGLYNSPTESIRVNWSMYLVCPLNQSDPIAAADIS
jgi:hypothetical protein